MLCYLSLPKGKYCVLTLKVCDKLQPPSVSIRHASTDSQEALVPNHHRSQKNGGYSRPAAKDMALEGKFKL